MRTGQSLHLRRAFCSETFFMRVISRQAGYIRDVRGRGNPSPSACRRAEALTRGWVPVFGPIPPRQWVWADAPGSRGTPAAASSQPCAQGRDLLRPPPLEAHPAHLSVRAEPGLAPLSQEPAPSFFPSVSHPRPTRGSLAEASWWIWSSPYLD